jgi:Mrp family chromosome partitioning ATPase
MGKVFKALSKSESEQPPHSLAAVVVAEEEARAAVKDHEPAEASRPRHRRSNIEAVRPDHEHPEAFDFLRFSLNAPAAEAFDGEANVRSTTRSTTVSAAREVTLDASRVDPHLVAFYDFDPRAAEEYNKTAITLISAAADQPLRRVLIASAQHGEGRTCVALNLACALAQAKQRVLVADTDMQRPSLLRLLGIEADTDIAEAVTHNLSATSATINVMPYGFHVLPLRERVENSAEILASPALREMLNDCEADYDFMIFDSSPLLDSKDANLLMKLTHATVMVVRPGKTNASHLSRAIAPLPEDNVFGVVLNRAG